MALAFPGIILYGIALHLFYIMILYAFSWVPLVSEILMLPPFLYKSMMPDGPFRIGFTNGLMSESMIIWFGIMLAWNLCRKRDAGK